MDNVAPKTLSVSWAVLLGSDSEPVLGEFVGSEAGFNIDELESASIVQVE